MENVIKVADVLQTSSLALRTCVELLLEDPEMSQPGSLVFDFSGIEFASRSFMDEFFNRLIVDQHASVKNMSKNLEELLFSVSKTQTSSRKRRGIEGLRIDTVNNLDELNSQLKGLSYL